MFALLVAVAVCGQDPGGFSEEDIAKMNRQWATIAKERERVEPQVGRDLKLKTGKIPKYVAPPSLNTVAPGKPRTGPLRPRPYANRGKPRPPVFVAVYPRVMPAVWTVPPHLHAR